MEIVDVKYGMITSMTDLEENEYQDWHRDYLNIPGLILVLSSGVHEDLSYICFFPHEPDYMGQRCIRSSRGIMAEDEKNIVIKTFSSIYCLEKDENCISPVDKVFLNALAVRKFMSFSKDSKGLMGEIEDELNNRM